MVVLAGVAQGCELQDCTLVGCASGVSITVSSEGPLPEGEYRVALLLDGVAHSCRGPVPDLSALTIRCEPEAPGLTVYFSEWAPEQSPPGTEASGLYIEIGSTPRRIELEISRDGTVLAAESFTPQYETHRPNGEGCALVCRNATLEAALGSLE